MLFSTEELANLATRITESSAVRDAMAQAGLPLEATALEAYLSGSTADGLSDAVLGIIVGGTGQTPHSGISTRPGTQALSQLGEQELLNILKSSLSQF